MNEGGSDLPTARSLKIFKLVLIKSFSISFVQERNQDSAFRTQEYAGDAEASSHQILGEAWRVQSIQGRYAVDD